MYKYIFSPQGIADNSQNQPRSLFTGSFSGINIQYTMEGDVYVLELTEEEYELYKKNCGTFKLR